MFLNFDPPAARTFRENKPTLLIAWWTTLFSAAIILFRVAGRYVRSERLFREDRLAFATLIPLFLRMALVHVVLLYGTNNIQLNDSLPELTIQRREIGSRLVLVSRLLYAATLWMLKFTITEFLKRLTFRIWRHSYEVTLRWIRWFLLLTFIAIVLSDLLECRPFPQYWQVRPDPGPSCRLGYAQLLTMGIGNVLTDILLVVFPIPIILNSSMSIRRKINLVLLFALSIIPIIVTLYRIPHVIHYRGRQQTRTLWASAEILAATAVANALILGSFVRDRGVKKQKWKVGSVPENIERSTSVRGTLARAWGSDEDLVRDLGIGLDLELRHHRHASGTPRLAPVATSGNDDQRYARYPSPASPAKSPQWKLPHKLRIEHELEVSSDEYEFKINQSHDGSGSGLPAMITPRKVSFFDVGGLLGVQDSPRSPRASDHRAPRPDPASPDRDQSPRAPFPFPSPTSVYRGSATLQDLGGLLSPITPPQPASSPAIRNFSRPIPPMPRFDASRVSTHGSSGLCSFTFHEKPRPQPLRLRSPTTHFPSAGAAMADDEDPFPLDAIPLRRMDLRGRIEVSDQRHNDVGRLLK